MALRLRQPNVVKQCSQENAPGPGKLKTNASKGMPKRTALGEITTNTVRVNKDKDVLKKEGVTQSFRVNKDNKDITVKKKDPLNSFKPKEPLKTSKPSTVSHPVAVPTRQVRQISTNKIPLRKTESVLSVQSVKAHPSSPSHRDPKSTVIIVSEPPQTVVDVDKPDIGKIFLIPEYANEIYAYLRQLEDQFTIEEEYLQGRKITRAMRTTLVDWLVDVQQEFNLHQETLHLCIAVLDIFLQKVPSILKDNLQLVGVTALFLACKYEETYSPDISDFVYITDSSVTKEQIFAMERIMVRKLDYSFGRPLSLHFLRRYSKVANVKPLQHSIGKYLLELALLDYSLVHVKPSLIAAVATYISLSICRDCGEPGPDLWTDSLAYYSSYTYANLEPIIPKLASSALNASNSQFQAIPKKYSASKFGKVSCLPELQSDVLKILSNNAE